MCADGRTDDAPPETAAATPRHLSPRQWGLIEIKYCRIDLRPDSLEPLGVERDPQRRRRDAKHILCLSAVVSSQRLLALVVVVVIVVAGLTMYSQPALAIQLHETKQKLQAAQLALRLMTVNSFSTRRLSSCTDVYAHTYDISTYSVQQ